MKKASRKVMTFKSMDSWREHFFPQDVASIEIDELSQDSESLGIALANSTFERHLQKKGKVRRAGQ